MARITLTAQLAAANARIAALEEQLTAAESVITDLQQQVAARDARIEKAIDCFKEMRAQLKAAQAQPADAGHPALRTERVATSRARTVIRSPRPLEQWQLDRKAAMDAARAAAMQSGRTTLTSHLIH